MSGRHWYLLQTCDVIGLYFKPMTSLVALLQICNVMTSSVFTSHLWRHGVPVTSPAASVQFQAFPIWQ